MNVFLTANTDAENVENKNLIFIANRFVEAVNKNITGGVGLKLSYDGTTKTVKHYDEVDGYYLETEKLSDLINQIYRFELSNQSEERDDYLILILKFIKDNICSDGDAVKTIKVIFKNLKVEHFFEDEISARFFKDKLNSYLLKL